jgi:DNA-binding NtrC family response regulator
METEILIIDDDQKHLKILENCLSTDFYVFFANNTIEAINLLNSHKN